MTVLCRVCRAVALELARRAVALRSCCRLCVAVGGVKAKMMEDEVVPDPRNARLARTTRTHDSHARLAPGRALLAERLPRSPAAERHALCRLASGAARACDASIESSLKGRSCARLFVALARARFEEGSCIGESNTSIVGPGARSIIYNSSFLCSNRCSPVRRRPAAARQPGTPCSAARAAEAWARRRARRRRCQSRQRRPPRSSCVQR